MDGVYYRTARSDDYEALQQVKEDASRRAGDGYPTRPLDRDVYDDILSVGCCWVAATPDDSPVGYALAHEIDGDFYLKHLFVRLDWGQKGIGATLLETIVEKALGLSCRAVTLTTGGTVPWNAPFYSRHGFVMLDQQGMPAYLWARLKTDVDYFTPESFPWIVDHPEHLPRVAMERVLRD